MDTELDGPNIGWLGIFRLGLVQAALGAIVILTTSTLNRVMVVELALPASLPGALVGWHYAVQLSRPRWGYGSDVGGRRAPWIIGGMVTLAIGAIGAAASTALMATETVAGILCAVLAFFVIGVGVGAAGTNLLALLATHTKPARKAAAAAITWIMMIVGFIITAGVAGAMLEPFSLGRLVQVTTIVSLVAVAVAALAVWGVEGRHAGLRTGSDAAKGAFIATFKEVWSEAQARRFTIFVFVSMLAYSAQDLILEPFAGLIYGYTPGESTSLAGIQNMGVLLGMIVTAVLGTVVGKSRARFMRQWTIFGCFASAIALAALCAAAIIGPTWPLQPTVFGLGLANGAFAVAAIGSMMTLASAGAEGREGTRMGLWGAAQAIAFGIGGFLGASALDVTRAVFAETAPAFAAVFAVEGVLFIVAAGCAAWVGKSSGDDTHIPALPSAELIAAE
ncbi:MAG: BCD family MFS transporter [Hyphomonadaceae bacterium]|nr:BCD family MFS transporter [Hyphomonadaceae bacterium]